MLGQDRPTGFGEVGRRRMADAAVGLHLESAVRLGVEGRANLPHLHLETEQRAGERQRRAPLTRTGLGGELGGALEGVVVGLRHSRVRLVRSDRADALVLVVDPCRCAEHPLEPVCAHQRRRAATCRRSRGPSRGSRCTVPSRPPARSGSRGTAVPGPPVPVAHVCRDADAAERVPEDRRQGCTSAWVRPREPQPPEVPAIEPVRLRLPGTWSSNSPSWMDTSRTCCAVRRRERVIFPVPACHDGGATRE